MLSAWCWNLAHLKHFSSNNYKSHFFTFHFFFTDYGSGYKWDPQVADITVGDIVYWKWFVPTYVRGMGYTVQQTANADATGYDGSGFHAGASSTQG